MGTQFDRINVARIPFGLRAAKDLKLLSCGTLTALVLPTLTSRAIIITTVAMPKLLR